MRRETGRQIACGALVAAAAGAALAPLGGNGFVSVDDDVYVTANPWVLQGLTLKGFLWALGTTHGFNWHPLTWLSHMADVSLFGAAAGAHHLVSLALHVLNALLVLLLLRRLTGRLPESALAAALFALHPLHVESVAWAAERKDVLGALFALLALLAYGRHAARPAPRRLLAVAGFLALSLAAKPMAVTLPFLLLLLDWWPLGRLRATPLRALAVEKAPLLLLSAAAAAVTYVAQRAGGATELVGPPSSVHRLGNAALSAVRYAAKALWPADLAVFYPYPVGPLPAWLVGAAAILLLAGFAVALAHAGCRPWLAAGALWYLGMLVPVSGVVQAGTQAMADRYTYLPLLGLFVAAVWGASGLLRTRRTAALAAAVALLAALAALSHRQALRWRDSDALLGHAVAAVPDNWPALYSLGVHLEVTGRPAEAETRYRESLRVNPGYVPANNNLARLLCLRGRFEEAIPHFRAALAGRPDSAMQHLNLGLALEATGRGEEAAAHYAEAARLDPYDPVVRAKAPRAPSAP